MTDTEKLSCLIDRPCDACKFHKEEGCSKWSCVFEEKSDVPEREKGEWIENDDYDECSVCHITKSNLIKGKFNFCPNCGADMRGEE